MKRPQEKSLKEAWVLCLVLGIIMINFPFIHIFNNDRLILGIPPLILYFFFGWPASILVTYFFVKHLDTDQSSASGDDRNNSSP